MSDMYGFGAEEQGEPQIQGEQGPAWFRSYMDKVSGQLKALQERNEQLEQAQRQQAVREQITAQGYAPGVADLYTGKPEGLNDWLSANGALFAKAAGAAEGEPQAGTQQGPPASTVSPESQAQQAAFAAAGQGAAGAAASNEDQLVARMNNASSLEELDQIMRENGSRYF